MFNKSRNTIKRNDKGRYILRIENDFVQGAIRAKKAGVDGIEIHGA